MSITKTALILAITAVAAALSCRQEIHTERETTKPNKLVIVWTSGDRYVAERMVFMYATASKTNGWWDRVRLVVWGPSAKLLAEDKGLQESLKKWSRAGWRCRHA